MGLPSTSVLPEALQVRASLVVGLVGVMATVGCVGSIDRAEFRAEVRRRGGISDLWVEESLTAAADRRSGGVITNAAVMTMTSSPLRTKPISRGAWIASVIFNDPPEPPPANVPPLPEGDDAAADEGLVTKDYLVRRRATSRGPFPSSPSRTATTSVRRVWTAA